MKRLHLCIACALMLGLLSIAPPVLGGNPGCDKINATAEGVLLADGTSQTTVRFVFGGKVRHGYSHASLVAVIPVGNGQLCGMTTHVIEVTGDGDGACEDGEDCFETTDMAFLTPVGKSGKYLLESNGIINPGSGKGMFEGKFGRLEGGTGFIQFPAGPGSSVSWVMHGTICSTP